MLRNRLQLLTGEGKGLIVLWEAVLLRKWWLRNSSEGIPVPVKTSRNGHYTHWLATLLFIIHYRQIRMSLWQPLRFIYLYTIKFILCFAIKYHFFSPFFKFSTFHQPSRQSLPHGPQNSFFYSLASNLIYSPWICLNFHFYKIRFHWFLESVLAGRWQVHGMVVSFLECLKIGGHHGNTGCLDWLIEFCFAGVSFGSAAWIETIGRPKWRCSTDLILKGPRFHSVGD